MHRKDLCSRASAVHKKSIVPSIPITRPSQGKTTLKSRSSPPPTPAPQPVSQPPEHPTALVSPYPSMSRLNSHQNLRPVRYRPLLPMDYGIPLVVEQTRTDYYAAIGSVARNKKIVSIHTPQPGPGASFGHENLLVPTPRERHNNSGIAD